MQQKVSLISVTPNAEATIAYCARVSHPENQQNPDFGKLIAYCIRHGHWSIFEQANLILEIETSRAIAPQILRHRSFSFQEFSQRYSVPSSYVTHRARRQDSKNKQNSFDDLDAETRNWFDDRQKEIWEIAQASYLAALAKGIAKESARALLPLGTSTRLYMNGTVRSWIHYLQLRTQTATQYEHREIALACQNIFCSQLPEVAKALGWRANEVANSAVQMPPVDGAGV